MTCRGVFRCTVGLQQRFGRERCFNTPLSEQVWQDKRVVSLCRDETLALAGGRDLSDFKSFESYQQTKIITTEMKRKDPVSKGISKFRHSCRESKISIDPLKLVSNFHHCFMTQSLYANTMAAFWWWNGLWLGCCGSLRVHAVPRLQTCPDQQGCPYQPNLIDNLATVSCWLA